MLRNLLNKKAVASEYPAILESLNVQVRWRRKPRWLGTAKTKVFRVPTRPVQDPEERAFMFKLSTNYRTQMKAIRSFLHQEVQKASLPSTTSVLLKSPEQLELEFQETLKINEVWNAECAKVRAARMEQKLKEQRDYVLERLQAKEERDEEREERIRNIIEQQKIEAKNFITEENIDEAIERAIANVVDYNFAIDLDGNMYKGSLSLGKEEQKTK
uniref:Small ribosomal subunit protein mS26 n=1 Tax=Culicoides sonorensis TaxID=179676 RepID=A0A336LUY8_CULSO